MMCMFCDTPHPFQDEVVRESASRALADLADEMQAEANAWHIVMWEVRRHDAALTIARSSIVAANYAARLLAQHAQHILGSGDLAVAQAYVEAAALQLRNLQGARRLLVCVAR